MDNKIEIVVPATKEKLHQQIKTLKNQIMKDTNDKDREIHSAALRVLMESKR